MAAISRSVSPVDRAAAASSARTASSAGFGGAAGGPEQAVVAVWLSGASPATQRGEVAQVPALGAGRPGGGLALRVRAGATALSQSRLPGFGLVADEPVGPAGDLGGRGEDVAALGAEVQVVAGQLAAVLAAAGEVGVQPAAGRGDDRAGALGQPGAA